jgi:hypothetical protein
MKSATQVVRSPYLPVFKRPTSFFGLRVLLVVLAPSTQPHYFLIHDQRTTFES